VLGSESVWLDGVAWSVMEEISCAVARLVRMSRRNGLSPRWRAMSVFVKFYGVVV
jgi:hypothetical protein